MLIGGAVGRLLAYAHDARRYSGIWAGSSASRYWGLRPGSLLADALDARRYSGIWAGSSAS